jgi:branched-chain amino acid transport system permease protein
MDINFALITLINGLSFGLLLFMTSAGLTLVYGLMRVMNFAHASFYMLGAYLAYSFSAWVGFGVALALTPVVVGLLALGFERLVLRQAYALGHTAEMLVTFGFAYLVMELVQLLWGRAPLETVIPPVFDFALFNFGPYQVGAYRVFSMGVALGVLLLMRALLVNSRWGVLIQAAVNQPNMLLALGHNVHALQRWVFSVGAGLAALAGVLAGNAYVTEPGMALHMGTLAFVVVVAGGLGSVQGAFWAAIMLGMLQTVAVSWAFTAPFAPLLPFAALALVLLFRVSQESVDPA